MRGRTWTPQEDALLRAVVKSAGKPYGGQTSPYWTGISERFRDPGCERTPSAACNRHYALARKEEAEVAQPAKKPKPKSVKKRLPARAVDEDVAPAAAKKARGVSVASQEEKVAKGWAAVDPDGDSVEVHQLEPGDVVWGTGQWKDDHAWYKGTVTGTGTATGIQYDDGDKEDMAIATARRWIRASSTSSSLPAPAPAPALTPAPAPALAPAPAPAPAAEATAYGDETMQRLEALDASIDAVTQVEEQQRQHKHLAMQARLANEGDPLANAPAVYLRRLPHLCEMFNDHTSNTMIWDTVDKLFADMTRENYDHPKWQGLQKYYKPKPDGSGYTKIGAGGKRGAELDHVFAKYANPFWHPRFMVVCTSSLNGLWADKSPAERVGLGTDRQAMREIQNEMKWMAAHMKREGMFKQIFAALDEEKPLQKPAHLR